MTGVLGKMVVWSTVRKGQNWGGREFNTCTLDVCSDSIFLKSLSLMDILAIEKDPIGNSREIWSRDVDF